MKKSQIKKKLPFIVGFFGLLLGSTILFLPLLDTFLTGEAINIQTYALINFTSYLFFTMTFIELLFAQMIRLGENPLILVPLAVITSMLALTVDYLIGYFFSKSFLSKIITEKKLKKYEERIQKYGNPAIFIFNVLPLSSPMLTLAAGLIRYDYKKLLFYSVLGLTIKYSAISIFIVYYL